MRKNQITLVCANCGTSFSVKASRLGKRETCSKPCKGELHRKLRMAQVEAKYGRPLREVLTGLYEQGGIKSTAKALGISDRVAWEWFEYLGIPRRDKSSAVLKQWETSPERRAAQSERMAEWMASLTYEEKLHNTLKGRIVLQTQRNSSLERKLMEHLQQAGISFTREWPVGPFLFDFLIPNAHLLVEVDGEYWHEQAHVKNRDRIKESYAEAYGYKVLRFTGKEVTHTPLHCIEVIKSHLPGEQGKASTGTARG